MQKGGKVPRTGRVGLQPKVHVTTKNFKQSDDKMDFEGKGGETDGEKITKKRKKK